ncbi:MAG: acyl--CoA ligase [Rhizobiaceae bacterium]
MVATIEELLDTGADDSPAIGGAGRTWLSYGGLRSLSRTTVEALRGFGIGHTDRVAIVLPNGPEMATAFLTIAQGAATAPLNPSYTQDEYEFYLDDLNAKALVIEEGYEGPALEAASKLGIAVITLVADAGAPAGMFHLEGESAGEEADPANPGPDDVALILHTSGTTSRPKIVPLTQTNVAISATNIRKSLALTSEDRSLNIMPLFHIHGLVASLSASMAAGASVWCAQGFNVLQVYSQMEEAIPTWITAVPTMHQANLSRAGRNMETIQNSRLRFLRSSSASLPAPVMEELTSVFGVPVVEAYGMTEAAHQMCSNPVHPGKQKPGFVGLAAGPKVQIADEFEDFLLESGAVGEVVISGPNVTAGYESNPDANEKSFFTIEGERWFRTGDQGAFDEDGYLQLTGRLKEIINRGGEKISPLEVDAILLKHPEIAQAVTFAVPHPKLGEDIAAAIVLSENGEADARAVRDYAASHLAGFKVPSKVIILEEIPKGATGKIQRIGLAEKLNLT